MTYAPRGSPPAGDPTIRRRLRGWEFSLLIFVPLFGLYLATSDLKDIYHTDAVTNALTAWALGTEGSLCVEQLSDVDLEVTLGRFWWFVEGASCPISIYSPGAAALAAPIYAIDGTPVRMTDVANTPDPGQAEIRATIPIPPIWPASIIAAVTTAIALMLFGLSVRSQASGDAQAIAAALVAGLGTTAWSVAADSLWQHGPVLMWMGIGFLLVEKRPSLGGLSYAAAVFTRPQIAPIIAFVGLGQAWKRRSWTSIVRIGWAPSLGLLAYLAYLRIALGAWLPPFFTNLLEEHAPGGISYVVGLALSAFSPSRGFLVWSPFLVMLVPGLRLAWRKAGVLVRASAVGGVVYFLLLLRTSVWHGGLGQFTYRYPLEMLYAAAPLLFLSYREWVQPRPLWKKVFVILVIASASFHAVGAWQY